MKRLTKDQLLKRALIHAFYIIEHTATIREVSQKFGWAIGTIERDIERIKYTNPELYKQVKAQLRNNQRIGWLQGATSTNKIRWGKRGNEND